VREVATVRQAEPHDPILRREERGERGEVGRAARVRLHVHTPLGTVKVESFESALAAQFF
jgi:hypothetical protein